MAADHPPEEAAWVHGHAHEPNPLPPTGDGSFVARLPDGTEVQFDAAALATLPQCEVSGCRIVSTGHGTTGPFTFGGVRLIDLLAHLLGPAGARPAAASIPFDTAKKAGLAADYAAGQAADLAGGRTEGPMAEIPGWQHVDVVSADGFGTRLLPAHLAGSDAEAEAPPIVLALRRDGEPLTRAQGLVRLIVPSERDDALRQVKWVARVEIA